MSAVGLTVEQVNNFAALEDQIVALLKAAVAGVSPAVHVLTAPDLDAVRETAQFVPALHVIGNGFEPADSQYKVARLRHTWYVVAVVRNQAAQRSGLAARRDAGPLLARAMNALLSAPLAGAATLLEPVRAPRGVHRNGYFYLPSGWQVETVFRKH